MKYSILAYGHSILRKQCEPVTSCYKDLEIVIDNMWDTMQHARGCGLAAPQIGRSISLFIVDSRTTYEAMEHGERLEVYDKDDRGIRETFINAVITAYSVEEWEDEEGCLSMPGLLLKIKRPWMITIEYYNRNFEKQMKVFSGLTARMVQHEYDHTQGILLTDHLEPINRRLITSKLDKITKGKVNAAYPMRFI